MFKHIFFCLVGIFFLILGMLQVGPMTESIEHSVIRHHLNLFFAYAAIGGLLIWAFFPHPEDRQAFRQRKRSPLPWLRLLVSIFFAAIFFAQATAWQGIVARSIVGGIGVVIVLWGIIPFVIALWHQSGRADEEEVRKAFPNLK